MKQMRFFVFFLVLTFTNLAVACQECPEKPEFRPCKKTYVEPFQVAFQENGIFIAYNEFVFQISALYSDTNGLFFQDVKRAKCNLLEWECPRCSACNWFTEGSCYVCSYTK